MAKSGKKAGGKRTKVKNLPRSKSKVGPKEMKGIKGGVFADGSVRFIKSCSNNLLPYIEQDNVFNA